MSDTPSTFLAAGFPSGSIFMEANHEQAAICYMHALVMYGDIWQPLTPQQVQDACKANGPDYGVTLNHERMQRVMDKLTCADDARAFSWAWRRDLRP